MMPNVRRSDGHVSRWIDLDGKSVAELEAMIRVLLEQTRSTWPGVSSSALRRLPAVRAALRSRSRSES